MTQLIQTLPGSDVHRLCIELYQRHSDRETDRCAVCGEHSPCLARRHAALVIRAAGDDPRWYEHTGVVGFALGGHGRPAGVPLFEYDR